MGAATHDWTPAIRGQEATASLLALHTIGLCVLICICVILCRALLLLGRDQERPPGFLAVVVIILVSSVARAIWLAGVWLGLSPPLWFDLLALSLTFLSLLTVPLVISWQYLFVAQSGDSSTARMVWISRFLGVISVFGGVCLVVALFQKNRDVILLLPPVVLVVAAVLIGTGVPLFSRPAMRRRGLLLFAGFTVAGLLVMAGVLTFAAVTGIRVRNSFGCTVILHMSLLSIVAGMLFVFANLRLADLIVKRVLRVAAFGYIAEGLCALIVVPLRWPRVESELVPRAAFYVLLVAAGTLLSWFAPSGLRLLDRWIDRWLFEQPDFDTVIEGLWADLTRSENSETVFRAAEQVIGATLSLAEAQIRPIRELLQVRAIDLPTEPGPHFVRRGSVLSQVLSPAPDVVLPLFMENTAEQWVVLRCGALRPPLTSMELSFVERVAAQVHIRVATLLAQQRRMETLRRERDFREALTEAELRALRAQINPHFLFNSLNTIADLTVTAPERAEEMTLRLSSVFRYLLTHTDRQFTSIMEELEFARSYLYIEEARFEQRLKVRFDIDPEALQEQVPTLLLQPLIENALRHGIGQKRDGGTVTISARVSQAGLTLAVCDDGRGLRNGSEEKSPAGTRMGLANVRNRLRAAYGGAATFTLRARVGGGSEALVEIAKRSLEEYESHSDRR